jgi:hypothetical protein
MSGANEMSGAKVVPPGVDPTKPSAGRLYDYYLGGTEWFEVDRIAAEKVRAAAPYVEQAAWANRGFLQRAARWLAAEAGIRQFIDIGAGLPTRNNTHEAAQSVAPDAKVVYVDNDPMVWRHGQALLADVENAVYIDGDLRDPDGVLNHPELRKLLNLSQPVGLMLVAVVHFLSDEQDPWGVVKRYMDALPSGSYLAISHGTEDRNDVRVANAVKNVYKNATEQLYLRSYDEVKRLFEGLELVPPYEGAKPDLTYLGLWGAEDPELADTEESRWGYCGVARKP